MANEIINGGVVNGSLSSSFTATKKGITTESSFTILVAADNLATTDVEILGTPNLPRLYTSYGGRYVNSVSPSQSHPGKHPTTGNDTYIWKVDFTVTNDLNLDNIPPAQDPQQPFDPLQPVNPLLIPAEISTDSITQIMPFKHRDAEGKIMSNYFGEPLAEIIENEVEIYVVTITRWEPWPFPFATAQQFNNTCNAAPFHGLPIGTCLMKIRAQKEFLDGTAYARVTYQIKVLIDEQDETRENTWVYLVLPHTSYKFLKTAGDNSSVTEKTDDNIKGPFLLKQDGTISDFYNEQIPNVSSAEHTLIFTRKRKEDWTSLNLPAS